MLVTPLAGVTAIGAGMNKGLALVGGTIWTWGSNFYGELGNGSGSNSSPVPVRASSLNVAVAIAGGQTHNLGIYREPGYIPPSP